jgi:hypothetical protein
MEERRVHLSGLHPGGRQCGEASEEIAEGGVGEAGADVGRTVRCGHSNEQRADGGSTDAVGVNNALTGGSMKL